jgi:hypothetical protein
MSAAEAAPSLFKALGANNALRASKQEQQKARRARSRKRFEFWTAVLGLLDEARIAAAAEGLSSNEAVVDMGALEGKPV